MKIDNKVIIASLKSEPTSKLIPGSHLLISNLPGSASRMHIEIARQEACLTIQQEFSKPCMVNLISKDTHLVFSVSQPLLFPIMIRPEFFIS